MKIAITADLHLVTQKEHPERFRALEKILDTLVDQEINQLIIAGDLFDISSNQPGEFEKVAGKAKYSKIQYHIIPGNHDPAIAEGTFVFPNIHYYFQPTITMLDKDIPFVFVPFKKGKTMGEVLSTVQELKTLDKWVLVGHGDWISGTVEGNPYEKGIYMPFSNRDIQYYHPDLVFLGHIHSPKDTPIIHIPGSACAVDSSEYGYRSFLIFSSENWKIERSTIDSEVIYFSEQLVVLPTDDEESFLRNEIDKKIKAWNLTDSDLSKVVLKVEAKGYSRNRDKLTKIIRDGFTHCKFLNSSQLDISEVKIAEGLIQESILKTAKERLDKLELDYKEYGINREEVLLAVVETIYGGRK